MPVNVPQSGTGGRGRSAPAQRPAPSAEPALPIGWTVLAALALTALATLGARAWIEERRAAVPPSPAEDLRLRLDLNSASPGELELLPGVGPARAARIVEARRRRGGFRSLSELDEKNLLGPGASERLAPHLLPLSEDRHDEDEEHKD